MIPTKSFTNLLVAVSNEFWSTWKNGFHIKNINDEYKPKTYDFYINTHVRSFFHGQHEPQSPALVTELKNHLNQKLGPVSSVIDKYNDLLTFITQCYEPDSIATTQNHVFIVLSYYYAETHDNFSDMTLGELLDRIATKATEYKREITKEYGVDPDLSEKIFPTINTQNIIDIFENGGGINIKNDFIDHM